jgi:coenzyme PQQ precursor peptide PqqA
MAHPGVNSGGNQRSYSVTWETPTAIEWRFGFEVTMYIANR